MFTPAQQGKFRPMVSAAWQSHCNGNAMEPRDKSARETWYRAELVNCLGCDTTKNADTGRDFEIAMAHFETFIFGESYWNFRIMQGDTRRLLHSVQEICAKNAIDDQYARAIAAKMLKWEGRLDSLTQITAAADLAKLRIALIKDARRKAKRAEQAEAAPADAAPRAPLIPNTREGLRSINPYYGATEAEFESEGVRERREASEAASEKLRKEARRHFAQEKKKRQRAQSLPDNTPAHAHASDAPEIDPDNCPF